MSVVQGPLKMIQNDSYACFGKTLFFGQKWARVPLLAIPFL